MAAAGKKSKLVNSGGSSGSSGSRPSGVRNLAGTTNKNELVPVVPARLFYRLLLSGRRISVEGDNLIIEGEPLSGRQRDALRAHKPALLALADFYRDDAEVICGLSEQDFLWLANDFLQQRHWYSEHAC